MVLTGNATLRRYRGTQLNDENVGNQIVYNSLTEVFTRQRRRPNNASPANPSGRVRAMLTPIPKDGASTCPGALRTTDLRSFAPATRSARSASERGPRGHAAGVQPEPMAVRSRLEVRRPEEGLWQPQGGQGRIAHRRQRRGRRAAGPQRRRQNHIVLHDRGPVAGRWRRNPARRRAHRRLAHSPPCAPGSGLPAPGVVDLSPPDGGAKRARRAGVAAR